jgi:signal transduction histidine kinase
MSADRNDPIVTLQSQNGPRPGLDFLAGGGEMGERIRALDWERTALGPPETWPHGLRVALRIMLASRQPIWVGWGRELTYFYNDSYKSIIGGRHPAALGLPAEQVWPEIWSQIGPMLRSALGGDLGTYVESHLLIMERNGYPEETYYTWSYTPIPNDDGTNGGIFCANSDDTLRVVGERQFGLLRELSVNAAHGRTMQQVCDQCICALATNARDLPFALIYLPDANGSTMTLWGASGISSGHPAAPISIASQTYSLWPEGEFPGAEELLSVIPLRNSADTPLPTGAWEQPPKQAAVVPIKISGQSGRCGALVVGLNPFRLLDESYRGFLTLLAAQIGAALGNAEAHEQERRRAEALAQIDQAKTVFFSNVSHEFRTPLTLMLGPIADAAAHPTTSAPVRDLLELAQRNSLRLLKLVNNLLDFSRIEAGRAQASYEATDLARYTSDLASTFRSAMERAGLAFTVECDELAEPVHVDREMWEKIVLNLLSNAFKFTLQGSVAVRLRQEESDAVLEVADTGVGIPARELPRLFERFHRVEGTTGRTQEGSGIGLALVQELVKLHGGTIGAQSELGTGTTFRVAVPLGSAHLPPERITVPRSLASTATGAEVFVQEALRSILSDTAETSPAAQALTETPILSHQMADAAAARILLADDNADMRAYVQGLLSPTYVVETVVDGEQALEAARRARPDLIVSDIMMPRLDGLGLLKALRNDDSLRDVPVVLLSARAGEETRVEGLDAGADDYLIKPFSARELLARVGARLELARVRRENEERLLEEIELRKETEAALDEASRRKDEFLAMLAHELRNPLAPIANASELLSRSIRNDPRAQTAIGMVKRQVTQLTRLVDDLLDVSRITQGRIELKKRPVDFAAVIAQAVETVGPQLRERRHRLSTTTSSYGPLFVLGDFTRLVQCVANLLTNAVKYTEPGGEISVRSRGDEASVVVEVADSGVGITPELLPRVFDLFVQSERSLDRATGGLGIGLAVVKRLVEMHAGEVQAQSDGPGRGSAFRILLPRIAGPEAVGSEAAAFEAAPRRVLVVDDNADAANSLSMLLAFRGHHTRVAYSAREALACVEDFRPDVCLLDVGLPEMNGYELARKLRETPSLGSARLIALTGYGQAEDRLRALAAGFDDHLVKPVDLRALEHSLSGTGGAGAQDELSMTTPGPQP